MRIATRSDLSGAVLTLEGPFEAASERELHDALLAIGGDRPIVIDFREVRLVEDFALARLAGELGGTLRGRVTLLGLSEHHHRLLHYFGLDPGRSVAAPTAFGNESAHAMPMLLLVDDDEGLRAVLADFLSNRGYQVCQASNVNEAVRHAIDKRPAAVLLDMTMPDGLQIREQLRGNANRAEVPVILISESQCPVPEGCAVLQKPFELDLLVAALESVLER
jgi:CheY-like chemotaxis protein/anti-anti-sigma regulatory factor